MGPVQFGCSCLAGDFEIDSNGISCGAESMIAARLGSGECKSDDDS